VALFLGEAGGGSSQRHRAEGRIRRSRNAQRWSFGTWHSRKLVLRLSPTCEDCVRIVDRAALISLEETAHVTVFSREFLDDLPLRGR
jgi:hypothetical protein